MTEAHRIHGIAAALNIPNLDTDQIMPKQFLRGIDKSGLAKGLLWDLRYDAAGDRRPGFILNQPAYADTRILIGGPNFGCGSSREHAVWGLQQFGIRAVIAPSFGEIFYSNAMNNGLLLAMVSEPDGQRLMNEAASGVGPLHLDIDIVGLTVKSPSIHAPFSLSARYRQMFLENLDVIGATLKMQDDIVAFAQGYWANRPWVRDIASMTRRRLDTLWAQTPKV